MVVEMIRVHLWYIVTAYEKLYTNRWPHLLASGNTGHKEPDTIDLLMIVGIEGVHDAAIVQYGDAVGKAPVPTRETTDAGASGAWRSSAVRFCDWE